MAVDVIRSGVLWSRLECWARRLSMPAGRTRPARARRCGSGGGADEPLLPAVSLAEIRVQANDRGDGEQRRAGVTIDIPALDDVARLSVIGQRGRACAREGG